MVYEMAQVVKMFRNFLSCEELKMVSDKFILILLHIPHTSTPLGRYVYVICDILCVLTII
jgi:hypothetical protein